jgi:hypothetical protein
MARAAEISIEEFAGYSARLQGELADIQSQVSAAEARTTKEVGQALAPLMNTLDAMILDQVRLKRHLCELGLQDAAQLGGRLLAAELVAGRHQIIGNQAPTGSFEVQASGLVLSEGNEVVAPALVLQVSEPSQEAS